MVDPRAETHKWFYILVVVLAVLMLGWLRWSEKETYIATDNFWSDYFYSKDGVRTYISHDDTDWFFKGNALCVGYGDPKAKCSKSSHFCSGGKVNGEWAQQSFEVLRAIEKGVHPRCPLLL